MVVIAIILSLAGLILAGLKSTRESDRRIRCVGNLRQIGLAMTRYGDDITS